MFDIKQEYFFLAAIKLYQIFLAMTQSYTSL